MGLLTVLLVIAAGIYHGRWVWREFELPYHEFKRQQQLSSPDAQPEEGCSEDLVRAITELLTPRGYKAWARRMNRKPRKKAAVKPQGRGRFAAQARTVEPKAAGPVRPKSFSLDEDEDDL